MKPVVELDALYWVKENIQRVLIGEETTIQSIGICTWIDKYCEYRGIMGKWIQEWFTERYPSTKYSYTGQPTRYGAYRFPHKYMFRSVEGFYYYRMEWIDQQINDYRHIRYSFDPPKEEYRVPAEIVLRNIRNQILKNIAEDTKNSLSGHIEIASTMIWGAQESDYLQAWLYQRFPSVTEDLTGSPVDRVEDYYFPSRDADNTYWFYLPRLRWVETQLVILRMLQETPPEYLQVGKDYAIK